MIVVWKFRNANTIFVHAFVESRPRMRLTKPNPTRNHTLNSFLINCHCVRLRHFRTEMDFARLNQNKTARPRLNRKMIANLINKFLRFCSSVSKNDTLIRSLCSQYVKQDILSQERVEQSSWNEYQILTSASPWSNENPPEIVVVLFPSSSNIKRFFVCAT